jgi:TonB family protein
MSAKKKHRTAVEYLKYLKRELSQRERHFFERELEGDLFNKEAMEGMEMISPGEVEEDLLRLNDMLRKRVTRRKRRTIYGIAATAASLLIVGTLFFNLYNFRPESGLETIPRDESFLHEEPVTPERETVIPGDKGTKDAGAEAPVTKSVTGPEKAASPDETPAGEKAPVSGAARGGKSDQATGAAPVQEVPKMELKPMDLEEHDAREDEVLGAVKAEPDRASQAVPEAGVAAREQEGIVAMEAQPEKSLKKRRAIQAPSAAPTERVGGIVVSSDDMEPLPGALIRVKGSDSGMVTDQDGRFSITTAPQSQPTVIASYVGMESDEYQLSDSTENRLVMHPDPASQDEVVLIGDELIPEATPSGAVRNTQTGNEDLSYNGAGPEGGLEAYKVYMEQNIRFPAGDTITKRGVVILTFNVSKEGTISRIQTLRSPGKPFTDEAIRLLKQGPPWKPARNESGPVDDVVRMRIVFKK